MKNTRAEELMAAYLSGNIKAGEREELMHWAEDSKDGRAFFDNAVSLWSITEQITYPDFSANKNKSWQKINQRVLQEEGSRIKPQAKVRSLRMRRWSAAAAIALLAMVGWWWADGLFQSVDLVATTDVGERTEFLLPDGSIAFLNENSHLSYEATGDERIIRFEGEAFFEVATDSIRPFKVYSGQSVTTVLGTSFNLRAYPAEEKVEVSVKEGRVALSRLEEVSAPVSPEAVTKVELAKGETGVLTKATAEVKTVKVTQDNSTAWKDRRLSFDDIPLSEVVETLERYYDVEIELTENGLNNCLVTVGEMNDPTLENVLIFLEATGTLAIESTNTSYRFSGQPCN